MKLLSIEFFIALRYLRSSRQHLFISLITVLSLLGVALGVFAIIVIMSVMGGFEDDLKDKLLQSEPHLTLQGKDGKPFDVRMMEKAISSNDLQITTLTPYLKKEQILQSRRRLVPADIVAVDSNKLADIASLSRLVVAGSTSLSQQGKLPTIIIGIHLAENLVAEIDDPINILSPDSISGPMGMAPKTRAYRVGGIFETGFYHLDATQAYVLIDEYRHFLGLSDHQSHGLMFRVNDAFETPNIARNITEYLTKKGFNKDIAFHDWQEKNSALFSSLQMEKMGMAAILLITIIVSSFSIITTLFLTVLEKTADIAVLKALGASRNKIARIFVTQGTLVGAVGTAIGFITALTFLILLDRYQFIPLPHDIYHLDHLPVKYLYWDYFWICLFGITLSTLATLFPSWKASRLEPVAGLRYE